MNTELDPGCNPQKLLAPDVLKGLNQRFDRAGCLQFAAHIGVLALSGYLWGALQGWGRFPALLVYGAGLAFMFCPTHECVHRTAFASPRLNDGVGWLAGVLSFYNSTFYRLYHKWHHRYTRIPGQDPELTDPHPRHVGQYLWQLSGIPWWWGKLVGHSRAASGQLEDCAFIPEGRRAEVIRSTRRQLALYGAIALISVALGHPWFLVQFWILPLALGQPMLRFVLLAEHTHCSMDDNPLTNTRTTLTRWPLRFLMWNMPYHAEHHLYPAIPFHALPEAHRQLKAHFTHLEPGYLRVNQKILASF